MADPERVRRVALTAEIMQALVDAAEEMVEGGIPAEVVGAAMLQATANFHAGRDGRGRRRGETRH